MTKIFRNFLQDNVLQNTLAHYKTCFQKFKLSIAQN